jgi:hypothetical protein
MFAMKKWTKALTLLLALCLMLSLAACGGNNNDTTDETETEQPEQQEENTEPETTESIAGTYDFNYVDAYGDTTNFTVTLRDGGDFNMMTVGAMGSAIYSGAEWTDNGDGTFTTGAVDPALDLDWVGADGTVTWTIDGSNVTPAGYTAPTEFLSKDAFKDPTNGAEAVGVYVFGQINDHGSTVPFVVWVNADGTYAIHMNNSFTGLHTYTGTSYTINSESVITFGPATFEGDEPMGDWFDVDNGFSSSWVLHGDGTCEPANYTGEQTTVTTSDLPTEIYPDGAEYVGVYLFGQINDHGSTVPYIVWINADGTAAINMNNSFTGLHTYTGEWTYEGDGVVSIGALSYEGDEPMGDWYDVDNGFASTWVLNSDGTCVPDGYTGTVAEVNGLDQPESVYPRYNSLAGTYYFGQINDHGSTVPFAVVLKDSGEAMIVMDNSFTGVHSYTGEWTDNGDGTVSIGALTYEGDEPMGDWFDVGNGFASSWTVGGGVCEPVGYTGDSTSVTASDFSDDAIAAINNF